MAKIGSMVVMVELDEASLALINRVKDENKRIRAKLDRATRRIASMVRERETMLTQEQAAILREVAKANVKMADHRADVFGEELHRVLQRQRITNAEHARLLDAALKERDEWKAKADEAMKGQDDWNRAIALFHRQRVEATLWTNMPPTYETTVAK